MAEAIRLEGSLELDLDGVNAAATRDKGSVSLNIDATRVRLRIFAEICI